MAREQLSADDWTICPQLQKMKLCVRAAMNIKPDEARMSYENILEGKLFHTKSTNIPSEGETTKHTIQQNLKHWWWDTPTKIVCCTCWWILRANNSSFLSNLIFFSRTQLSRCEALNNPQVNRVAFLRCCKDSENHRSFSADVRGSRISQLCEIRKHKRGHHRLGKKIKFQEIF